MHRILNFIAKHRTAFVAVNAAIFCLVFVAGCAGTFLSEAPQVIEAVLGSLSGILAVVGILVPGASAFIAAINEIIAEIQAIETLVEEYKTTPDETLLQKIEAAIQLAITNIQPLLAPLGLLRAARIRRLPQSLS